MDILEFLNDNRVIVGESTFPKEKAKKNIINTNEQISLVVEIQKILIGRKTTMLPRIESSIGKDIANFIVQIKKIEKMIEILDEKNKKSNFDYFIIGEGNKALDRAKNSLNSLNDKEYLELIMRSMNNYEICLGRVDEGNLIKINNIINIRTIRYLSYNLLENDCYNYIKRLRKKGIDINTEEIINCFLNKWNLDDKSLRYINVLANYPIESMKLLLKLKYDKSKFTEEQWIEQINLSKKIDGKELL